VNFVAFVFFLAVLSGPQSQSMGFNTREECEAAIAGVKKLAEEHNRSGEPDKIERFAAVCVKTERAPSGAS
jgi:hypothetical protein